MKSALTNHASSYKDKAGFIFKWEEKYYRRINACYFPHYRQLMGSGLYAQLTKDAWLISHTEMEGNPDFHKPDTITILPEQIPVISYPYEWSFGMWKDAAILTLKIALATIEKGMILKDATPFNIQFLKGKPQFIDTLSFENYVAEKPWVAYRQFCESFLAPILLQQYCHREAGKIFTLYPNGIPLDILVTLLPKRSKWNLHNYLHIFLQARLGQGRQKNKEKARQAFSKQKMLILLNGLLSYVSKIQVKKTKSVWDDYYDNTILSNAYLQEKTRLVQQFLTGIEFQSILDLGANDGHFSLLYKDSGKSIIAVDSDSNCMEELYHKIRSQKIRSILPLVNALENPSPAIGWHNEERAAFYDRIKGDVVFALALVHHLAIALNIPLPFIADWLASLCKYLLIEFVPKSDEKVQLLLENREDIFDDYSISNFEQTFSNRFEILTKAVVPGSPRTLYLMKRINETA